MDYEDKNNNMGLEDEDRISQLPDALIHHILSFLSTKEAFVTYILSTRWKWLWNSIPRLSFLHWRSFTSVDVHLETKGFMNFMDRILHLRGFSTIQSFSLYCDEPCDESRANAWICTVISRNVEWLFLQIYFERPFVFPCCLFTCQSLKSLSIEVDYVFKVPSNVSFPRLEVFTLSVLQFEDEYSIEKLLSNCPVLKQFVITCCWWVNLKNVLISAPKLYLLALYRDDNNNDGLCNSTVTIHSTKLNTFAYSCSIAKDYDMHLPSVQDACIEILDEEIRTEIRREEAGYGLIKLLSSLSNVETLTLSGETLKGLLNAGDRLVDLPKFYNLTCLRVSTSFPCSANRALLQLLRISPNLELLCFEEGLVGRQSNDWVLDLVPQCLLLHLKQFDFREFNGSERDVYVLQLFLKNAIVLEKMTVISSFPLPEKTKEQVLKLPKGSASCEIKFCLEGV